MAKIKPFLDVTVALKTFCREESGCLYRYWIATVDRLDLVLEEIRTMAPPFPVPYECVGIFLS